MLEAAYVKLLRGHPVLEWHPVITTSLQLLTQNLVEFVELFKPSPPRFMSV
jgi:hypothetical protein